MPSSKHRKSSSFSGRKPPGSSRTLGTTLTQTGGGTHHEKTASESEHLRPQSPRNLTTEGDAEPHSKLQVTIFDKTQWHNVDHKARHAAMRKGRSEQGSVSDASSDEDPASKAPTTTESPETVASQEIPGEDKQEKMDRSKEYDRPAVRTLIIRAFIFASNVVTVVLVFIPYGAHFTPKFGLLGMVAVLVNVLVCLSANLFLSFVVYRRKHLHLVSRAQGYVVRPGWATSMALVDAGLAVALFYTALLLVYYASRAFRHFADSFQLEIFEGLPGTIYVVPVALWALGAALCLAALGLHLWLLLRNRRARFN